jgi:TonB family protein
MISPAFVANLLSWSVQVAAVVSVASLLPEMFKLDAPGVRYAYWRTVATLCLALPWIQRYERVRSAMPAVTKNMSSSAIVTTSFATSGAIDGSWSAILLLVIAAGIVLRFLWLACGLIRLRRLRRAALVRPAAAIHDDLQSSLGTRATIRFAPALQQPLTFGVHRPLVLLPQALCEQSEDIQRAVLGHELLHVKRRDWAWLIVEEIAVCLLWFHPASWWVASRIQRAREEVVDELAVLLTGRRKTYVEALLAFADRTSVVPTAAFARRRHLLRRIALVTKEDVMSPRRIVATCAAMALIIGLGSWYAVSAFPLQDTKSSTATDSSRPGPLERAAHAPTPENPVPRRVHYEEPVLPDWIRSDGALVDVKVTLDAVGQIAEARTVDVYRKVVQRTDAETDRQATQAFADAALASVRQWRYDPPFEAPLTFNVQLRLGQAAHVMEFSSKEPKTADDGDALRVGGNVKPPQKIRDVRPVYPPVARDANVTGVVIIETRIGRDGAVETAHVLKSIPLLDEAALAAVSQWRFAPTLMNGAPVPVIMTVTVNFTQN